MAFGGLYSIAGQISKLFCTHDQNLDSFWVICSDYESSNLLLRKFWIESVLFSAGSLF